MANRKPKKSTKKKTQREAPQNVTAGENPAIVADPNRREKLGKPHHKEIAVTGSHKEFEACAGELVALLEEEAKVKEQKREANAKYREKLAGIDDRKLKLSGALKSNRVLRPVLVQDYLLANNVVETVMVEGGEVVEKRTAEARDLQPELFAGSANTNDDEGDDDE